jgi:hypothetical protein
MFHFYVLLSKPWSVTGKEHFYSLSPSFAMLSFALTALSGLKTLIAENNTMNHAE